MYLFTPLDNVSSSRVLRQDGKSTLIALATTVYAASSSALKNVLEGAPEKRLAVSSSCGDKRETLSGTLAVGAPSFVQALLRGPFFQY